MRKKKIKSALKKLIGWAFKTLKREAKEEIKEKVIPFEDLGLPRRKRR